MHGRAVADDVFEPVPVAHLGSELRVLLEEDFLLPHDHPVDLDGLAEEGGDDIEEAGVAAELVIGGEGFIDRERAGRPTLDLDRDA